VPLAFPAAFAAALGQDFPLAIGVDIRPKFTETDGGVRVKELVVDG
jgi:hypothetical protein